MTDLNRASEEPDRRVVVAALGITQIFAWGSTLYLLGVLGHPIALETGWSYESVISGVSVGLLTASIISPRIGRAIGRKGGKVILAMSAVSLALELLSLGLSQSIVWYLAAWLLIGVGMGSGLTDAAFSTLGSIYGEGARSAITSLTLFAGFASTICWPLSAYLVEHWGWRGACFAYAAIQTGVAFPVLLLALPNRSLVTPSTDRVSSSEHVSLAPGELPLFVRSCCRGHLKRIDPFNARRPLIAGTSSARSGAFCGRRARRPCRSVAGGRPRRGDAGWSPLPSNLDDGSVNNLSNGGYLNAPFRLSRLRRCDRTIRCREWHWLHRSWNSAARVVRTVAIPGTDGPSRPADSNVNGDVAFRGSNCVSTWGPELTSLASNVYWNYKRATRRSALDLNRPKAELI